MTRREWVMFGLCVAIWTVCALLWVTRVEAHHLKARYGRRWPDTDKEADQ